MKLFQPKPQPPTVQKNIGSKTIQYFKRFLLFTVLIETERQDVAEFFKTKPMAMLLDVLNSKIIKYIGGIK